MARPFLRRLFSSLHPRQIMPTKLLQTVPSSIAFDLASDAAPAYSDPSTQAAVEEAAALLKQGEVVGFPTETVYGLGADALNGEAVLKIFAAKGTSFLNGTNRRLVVKRTALLMLALSGRPSDNPLIVHVSSTSQLSRLLPEGYTPSPLYLHLMKSFWPGPLTLLFPASPSIPPQTTANLDTVGVRMPSHSLARALIHAAGTPLAAPSANASGRPSPTRALHVSHDLDGRIPAILDGGDCSVGLESTVLDGLNEDGHLRILRPGGVTKEQLERAVVEFEGKASVRRVISGEEGLRKGEREKPRTPGMKYKHYTPTIPVYLFCPRSDDGQPVGQVLLQLVGETSSKVGLMAYSPSALDLAPSSTIELVHHPLGDRSNPEEAARRLFDGFLSLEAQGCAFIVVEEGSEEDGVGVAVAERVRKAVGKDGRFLVRA
jgi:L-threonylcarbamoyladenylate synthase